MAKRGNNSLDFQDSIIVISPPGYPLIILMKPGEYPGLLGRISVGSPKDLRSSFIYRVRRKYGEVLKMLWGSDEVDTGFTLIL